MATTTPPRTCDACGEKYTGQHATHLDRECKARKPEEPTQTEDTQAILVRPIIPPKIFGFDMADGHALRGIYGADKDNNPEPIIIRSDRKLLRAAMFDELGLKFSDYPTPTTQFLRYTWSRSRIKQWLTNKAETHTVPELFVRVRVYLTRYYHHPNPAAYDVLACYILALHVWIAFDAFPRLFVQAQPDSGKSQLLRAIRNLAANPVSTGDATKASLYRLANSTGGLLIFDNCDKLPEEQKTDVAHFIELSYQGDLPSYRAEDGIGKGKRKVATVYNARAPCAVGATDFGFLVGAPASRGIHITSERAPKGKKYPELDGGEPSPDSDDLRNDLYEWAMDAVEPLRAAVKEYEVKGISNRQAQIAKPLLLIADSMPNPKSAKETSVHDSVARWLAENYTANTLEDEFGEHGQLVRALYRALHAHSSTDLVITPKELAMLVLSEQGVIANDEQGRQNMRYPALLNAKCQKASAFLRKIPEVAVSNPKNKTTFTFKALSLYRYWERHDLLTEDEKENLSALGQTVLKTDGE